MREQITIIDPQTGRHITGKLHKRYEKGLCIDDLHDIRRYVTFDRVISTTIQIEPVTGTLSDGMIVTTTAPLF